MSRLANPIRGETTLAVAGTAYILRPSFENLVAAEEELGSLFALVESASNGALTIAQMSILLWHCLETEGRPDKSSVGEALLDMGLVAATKPVRSVLAQALQGKN